MNPEAFVQKYGGDRVRNFRGGWLISCPLGTHSDNNPSFSLSTIGLFKCWSCGEKGNFTRLLHDVAGHSWKQAASIVDALGLKKEWVRNRTLRLYDQEKPRTISMAVLGFYDVDWHEAYEMYQAHGGREADRRPPWAMIFDKGLTPTTLMQFQVGYDREWQRLTIPVWNDEWKLLGLVGRACRPADYKYIDYNEFKHPQHVYNLQNTEEGDEVLVVEGALDVWMARQWRIPLTAVAIMTAHISHAQCEALVEKHERIALLFDGDSAGQGGMIAVARALTLRGAKVDLVVPPKGVEDVKTLGRERFLWQYKKRKPYPCNLDE